MNENIELVREDIDVDLETKVVDLSLFVEMVTYNNAPFEFKTSIDELGQIVLTPNTMDVNFASVSILTEDDPYFVESESCVTADDETTKVRKTNIRIKGNMLVEDDNVDVTAIVDEIGQIVIQPVSKNNSFVTASIDDSLNLITEDLKVEEYCGYNIFNTGDGWDVETSDGEIVEEGLATLNAAKALICKLELKKFEDLNEDIQEQPAEEQETATEVELEEIPEVTAEVVVEEVIAIEQPVEFTPEQVKAAIVEITENFTLANGAVKCDTEEEQKVCIELLEEHYSEVTIKDEDDLLIVDFSGLVTELTEAFDETKKLDLINNFMRGEVPLFSDTGIPNESYIHIQELDSNGYEYYYDEETHAIVSYPERDEVNN